MPARSRTSYQQTLYPLVLTVAVQCPHCGEEALVQSAGFPPVAEKGKEPKLSCVHCGHSRWLPETPEGKEGYRYILGKPVDPYFHLPLWLQTGCGEHTLWAYNLEHLQLLDEHIRAGLRERKGLPLKNKSLGSRLPRWMTAAKKREELLKCIAHLRAGRTGK